MRGKRRRRRSSRQKSSGGTHAQRNHWDQIEHCIKYNFQTRQRWRRNEEKLECSSLEICQDSAVARGGLLFEPWLKQMRIARSAAGRSSFLPRFSQQKTKQAQHFRFTLDACGEASKFLRCSHALPQCPPHNLYLPGSVGNLFP